MLAEALMSAACVLAAVAALLDAPHSAAEDRLRELAVPEPPGTNAPPEG